MLHTGCVFDRKGFYLFPFRTQISRTRKKSDIIPPSSPHYPHLPIKLIFRALTRPGKPRKFTVPLENLEKSWNFLILIKNQMRFFEAADFNSEKLGSYSRTN